MSNGKIIKLTDEELAEIVGGYQQSAPEKLPAKVSAPAGRLSGELSSASATENHRL